jgi:hypothetical protein
MDQNLKDILETVISSRNTCGATKDDVRSIIQQLVPEIVAVELGPVHQQLREINQRLDVLDIGGCLVLFSLTTTKIEEVRKSKPCIG